MERRRLGSTDLELTTVGIGTWAIGGGDWKFGWGPQDEDEAVAAILHGTELGINWIDTAAVYGDGRSEEIVARALKQIDTAQHPYVATKCGRVIQADGSIIARISRESIMRECEASLRRLQIECIDLYQIHWPEPAEDIEEAWQTMCDLKRAGKVRHVGLSNYSVEHMERLTSIHPIASLQPPYSMFAIGVESEILPYCKKNGIGVVCYSPMCKGLLTGAFSVDRASSLPDDDHRGRDPKFRPPLLEINLQFVESLRPIAQRHHRCVAELAVAWVLRRSEVTSAIVGARRPQQIAGVVAAGDWRLAEDDSQEIATLLDQHQAAIDALGPVDTGRI